MIWTSYRAATGMIDSSSVCVVEGHSSPTTCVYVCVCMSKFFTLPLCVCECNLVVKAVYCRQWYVKFVCPRG